MRCPRGSAQSSFGGAPAARIAHRPAAAFHISTQHVSALMCPSRCAHKHPQCPTSSIAATAGSHAADSQPAAALRRAAAAAHHALRVSIEAVVVSELLARPQRACAPQHHAPPAASGDRLHVAVGPARSLHLLMLLNCLWCQLLGEHMPRLGRADVWFFRPHERRYFVSARSPAHCKVTVCSASRCGHASECCRDLSQNSFRPRSPREHGCTF